jgi:hypothetical protein
LSPMAPASIASSICNPAPTPSRLHWPDSRRSGARASS